MRLGKKIEPTELMYKTLKMCKDFYETNPCGGDLHIVLDDDNIEDHYIKWCVERTDDYKALEIADHLLHIPEEHRIWVTYNIYSEMIGDVYEELEDEY